MNTMPSFFGLILKALDRLIKSIVRLIFARLLSKYVLLPNLFTYFSIFNSGYRGVIS